MRIFVSFQTRGRGAKVRCTKESFIRTLIVHLWQLMSISEHSGGALSLNTTVGLAAQFTWTETRNFSTYASLKQEVESEYESEYEERVAGDRDAMDPYVYDLYQAVRYVEEFGGKWTLRESSRSAHRPQPCE